MNFFLPTFIVQSDSMCAKVFNLLLIIFSLCVSLSVYFFHDYIFLFFLVILFSIKHTQR